jgi:hypothetical protein
VKHKLQPGDFSHYSGKMPLRPANGGQMVIIVLLFSGYLKKQSKAGCGETVKKTGYGE